MANDDVYLAVVDGKPVDACVWDGVTKFEHPSGGDLVKASEWRGAPYMGPEEPDDARVKRTTSERLDTLIGNLRDDLAGFDAMTAAQRQAAQRRSLRAVLLLARVVREDHTGTVE